MNLLATTCLILLFCSISFAQTNGKYTSFFSEEKLKSTIKFLADDGFEGRAPGSRGGELAAKYIANQLELLGVNATVRRNRGTTIDAACGQLAARARTETWQAPQPTP